jgi:hypothetical protein
MSRPLKKWRTSVSVAGIAVLTKRISTIFNILFKLRWPKAAELF